METPLVPVEFVNVNGRPVSTAAQKRVKVSRDTPAEFHKGRRVVGYGPGAVHAAELAHLAAVSAWNEMSNESRSAAIKNGAREPGTWDFDRWQLKNRKTPVRSKPYSVESAANECASMAGGAIGRTSRLSRLRRGGHDKPDQRPN